MGNLKFIHPFPKAELDPERMPPRPAKLVILTVRPLVLNSALPLLSMQTPILPTHRLRLFLEFIRNPPRPHIVFKL